jgi:hypothetical protein
MSTGAVIGIIIAVIVVVAVVVVASAEMRRAKLRREFGPEYDRLVEKLGSRRKADAELAERERRVRALNTRELSREQQASYSGDWAAIQERFVDSPAEAVGAAHTLIWNVMRDRGYPVNDRTASMDALSVFHGSSMEGYRTTLDLRTDSASTEQLREAMIRHRALFEDLTGLHATRGEPIRDRVAAIRDRGADRRAVADGGTRTAETAEPVTAEPVTAEPVTAEPVTAEPVTAEPVTAEPVTAERVTAEPAAEARDTRDLAAEDSAAKDRGPAARTDERTAESASRAGYPPR